MIVTVRKAFVYLIRNEHELLVLAHPENPEAGLQVPAGTIEADEEPEAAAGRELTEETGLWEFHILAFLGDCIYDLHPFGTNELHHRFFYHADFWGTAPARWRHMEEHGGPAPISFELFWWNLQDGVPDLTAGHGEMLHHLPQRGPRKT